MFPHYATDILLYYAGGILIGLFFFMRRRPRRGMRLRLRGARASQDVEGSSEPTGPQQIDDGFSRIRPEGERPLNVVFNYNGHSWDAYEVLGLPAGSSPEKVERAFATAMKSIDKTSWPFVQSAYEAIQAQWDTYRRTGGL